MSLSNGESAPRKFEIPLIAGQLVRAMLRGGHSVAVVRRQAPDLPPARFGFEKIAEGMIGVLFLEMLRIGDRGFQIEGVDFFQRGGGGGRNGEFFCKERS